MGGGVAIFPTDTVYGIGCDPRNAESVKRIYSIKSRDLSKPLPVLVYSKEVAEKIAVFDDLSSRMAAKFWPGQLTIILKVKDSQLKSALGLQEKIAVRVPGHKCTLNLLKMCDMLVGTSANISGHESFTDPAQCPDELFNYDVFVDGGVVRGDGGGKASTIIESINEKIRILRKGSLDMESVL